MQRRSNLMVLLGVAFLLIGMAVVFIVTKDDDGGGGGGATGEQTVLVATADISAGTTGKQVIDQKQFRTETRPIGSVPPDSLTDPSQLNGRIIGSQITSGQPFTGSALVTSAERQFTIPKGFEAITIQFDLLSGAAKYAQVNDRINIFAVIAECKASVIVNGASQEVNCPYSTPRAQLLLSNVQVLDVERQLAPTTAATPGAAASDTPVDRVDSPDKVTFVLAVKTGDAEKLIYQTEFQRMYVTITAKGAAPAGDTPGRDFTNILAN